MNLLKSSAVGALILVTGRIFGAIREIWLAQALGPTDALADYVLASSIYLPVGGLLGGVASALMLRRTAEAGAVASVLLPVSCVMAALVISGAAGGILPSATIHVLFASSLPFYVVYGIGSGALLVKGRVVSSLAFSILPPMFSCFGLFIPGEGSLVGVAAGNWTGSAIMALLVSMAAHGRNLRFQWEPTGRVGNEALAIALVSVINIGSPIVDRFFASHLGKADLVLLNLSAIVFLGIVGTLGMAIGNAAVGRESTGGQRYDSVLLLPLPILFSVGLALSSSGLAEFLTRGPMLTADDQASLSRLLEWYGIATACAVTNQVLMRVWNMRAPVRAMVVLAGGLFLLNVAANLVLVSVMGVMGIVISTLLVQVSQCVILGLLTQRRLLGVIMTSFTLLGAGYVFVR